MSELTLSQQTPSSPPGGAETQMSKCESYFLFIFNDCVPVCCKQVHSLSPLLSWTTPPLLLHPPWNLL